jgi:hypothetical protein
VVAGGAVVGGVVVVRAVVDEATVVVVDDVAAGRRASPTARRWCPAAAVSIASPPGPPARRVTANAAPSSITTATTTSAPTGMRRARSGRLRSPQTSPTAGHLIRARGHHRRQKWAVYGDFDPAHPVELLFDGTNDNSGLVGLSYVAAHPGDEPLAGFTGPNDLWHRHHGF